MITAEIKNGIFDILREAGKIMLSAHGVDNDGVTSKEGTANFVTVYDVKTQNFIIDGVKKLIPEAVFIAEEKENDASVLDGEYCFVIDPIDGTTNFIREYHHSCISLAMITRGKTVFGAVYDPYLDELFTAEKGNGAYVNGKRISVSDKGVDMAIVAYGTAPYYKATLADSTFGICKDIFMVGADVRRCGSAALDLAYTAAGRNDAFFECLLSPWDYAAGMLLVTEAGGFISDMTGAEVSLARASSVVAGNAECYAELMKISKKYM